jgi:hypothetical protein
MKRVVWLFYVAFLLLVGLVVLYLEASEPATFQEIPGNPANIVNSSDSAIIPRSQLASAVTRFEGGDLNLAYPLETTYRELGDEVTASIYSRSQAVKFQNAQYVAQYFDKLASLETSWSVCEAMKKNLEVWQQLPISQLYNYEQSQSIYKQKCH